ATPEDSDGSQTDRLRLRWLKTILSLLFFCFAVGVLACPQILAQARDKTLSGSVRSASGAPVANAHLVLKDIANNKTKSLTANREGCFSVSRLPQGTYEITASKMGFADVHTTVTLSAGSNSVVNLIMEAGNGPSTGKAQVGSSSVSGVVKSTSLSDLPLN